MCLEQKSLPLLPSPLSCFFYIIETPYILFPTHLITTWPLRWTTHVISLSLLFIMPFFFWHILFIHARICSINIQILLFKCQRLFTPQLLFRPLLCIISEYWIPYLWTANTLQTAQRITNRHSISSVPSVVQAHFYLEFWVWLDDFIDIMKGLWSLEG